MDTCTWGRQLQCSGASGKPAILATRIRRCDLVERTSLCMRTLQTIENSKNMDTSIAACGELGSQMFIGARDNYVGLAVFV